MQITSNQNKNKSGIITFFHSNGFQIALLCVLVFLVFYRLQYYPMPWFDEGVHLLLANELASGNPYPFDTTLGPTILLPVAAVIRLFGISLLPARAIMGLYLLVCVFIFYFLVKHLTGKKAATLAAIMFVLSPGLDAVYLGRNILGEVPGMVFFFWGTFLFYHTLKNEKSKFTTLSLIITGVLFSFCVLSKYQLLILLPAWLLFSFINMIYYKRYSLKFFLVPFLVMTFISLTWIGISSLNVPKNVEQASQFFSRGILHFSPPHAKASFKFLLSQEVYWGWLLPGIFYAFIKSLKKDREGIYWNWLLCVIFGWSSWFILFSASWPRYAFIATGIGAIFVSALFYEISNGFSFQLKKFFKGIISGKLEQKLLPGLLIFVFLVISLGYEGASLVKTVVSTGNSTAFQMADYIKENITPGDILETYEPEMCFLSGAACHLPPSEIMDIAITFVWYQGPSPAEYYKLEENLHPYLLTGVFNAWVKLYTPEVINQYYEIETKIGDYSLYRLKENL